MTVEEVATTCVHEQTTTSAYLQALHETRATGLEPATSGVTDRSWRFRAERG